MKFLSFFLFLFSSLVFAESYPFDGSLKRVDLARDVSVSKYHVMIDGKVFPIDGSRAIDSHTAINSGTGKRICKAFVGTSKRVASNKIVALEAGYTSGCGIFGGTKRGIPYMYTYHLISLREDGRPMKIKSLQVLSTMMLPKLRLQELLVDQIWKTNGEFKSYLKSSWGRARVRASVRSL